MNRPTRKTKKRATSTLGRPTTPEEDVQAALADCGHHKIVRGCPGCRRNRQNAPLTERLRRQAGTRAAKSTRAINDSIHDAMDRAAAVRDDESDDDPPPPPVLNNEPSYCDPQVISDRKLYSSSDSIPKWPAYIAFLIIPLALALALRLGYRSSMAVMLLHIVAAVVLIVKLRPALCSATYYRVVRNRLVALAPRTIEGAVEFLHNAPEIDLSMPIYIMYFAFLQSLSAILLPFKNVVTGIAIHISHEDQPDVIHDNRLPGQTGIKHHPAAVSYDSWLVFSLTQQVATMRVTCETLVRQIVPKIQSLSPSDRVLQAESIATHMASSLIHGAWFPEVCRGSALAAVAHASAASISTSVHHAAHLFHGATFEVTWALVLFAIAICCVPTDFSFPASLIFGSATSQMWAILYAPLVEETIKLFMSKTLGLPRFLTSPMFGYVESILAGFHPCTGPSMAMHIILGWFTYWQAVLLHSIFNFIVIFTVAVAVVNPPHHYGIFQMPESPTMDYGDAVELLANGMFAKAMQDHGLFPGGRDAPGGGPSGPEPTVLEIIGASPDYNDIPPPTGPAFSGPQKEPEVPDVIDVMDENAADDHAELLRNFVSKQMAGSATSGAPEYGHVGQGPVTAYKEPYVYAYVPLSWDDMIKALMDFYTAWFFSGAASSPLAAVLCAATTLFIGSRDLRSPLRRLFAVGYRVSDVELPPPGDHDAKVKFHRNFYDFRPRRSFASTLGFAFRWVVPPYPDFDDAETVLHGSLCRFCKTPPKVARTTLRRLKLFVRRYVREHYTPIPLESNPNVITWLLRTTYPLWRILQLIATWVAQPFLLAASFYNKSFAKKETYGSYKPARAINSRTDTFKCYSGPYFKLMEDQIYHQPCYVGGVLIDAPCHPFIKHIPVHLRPQFMRMMFAGSSGPFYETDYSQFEKHFTPDIMSSLELILYEHMLLWYPEVYANIKRALRGKNRCEFKHFTITIDARRMSGDMCTSLGNGFSNLMLMKFAAFEKGGTAFGVVEGDDALFVSSVSLGIDDFERLGFTIKLDTHTSLHSTAFCGMTSSSDGILLRDIRRVIPKFGWSFSQRRNGSQRVRMSLLRARALSLAYESPRCPIIHALAKSALAATEGSIPIFDPSYHHSQVEHWIGQFPDVIASQLALGPSMISRVEFAEKYGISIPVQLRAEELIHAWDGQPSEDKFLESLFHDSQDMRDFALRFVSDSELSVTSLL